MPGRSAERALGRISVTRASCSRMKAGPDLVVDDRREPRREPLAVGRRPALHALDVGQRREQRPVARLAVEQVLEDRDRPLAGRLAGDLALGEAAPEAVEVAIGVDGHRAPPGEHPARVLRGLEALVVGHQEEVGRDPLEGIDVPVEQAGVQLGDVGRDGLAEHQEAGLVLTLERARVQLVDAVEEVGVRVAHRGRALGRRVGQPVVEPLVADGRGEQRVRLEVRLPVLGGERLELCRRVRGGRVRRQVHRQIVSTGTAAGSVLEVSATRHRAAPRHRGRAPPRPQSMHGPTSTAPVRPIAGATRLETATGLSA